MSTRRRTKGIYASPTPKGPNGERLCRNCHKVLEKGQRHNCSSKCSDEWMCKTSPSHLRWVLQQRDHGICATCGLDTLALKDAVDWLNARVRKGERYVWNVQMSHLPESTSMRQWSHEEWYGFLKALKISHRWPGSLWDADHITPVVEGGGECGLDNYRTLCIPCHQKETAALRRRLAEERKRKKPLPLLEAS